MELNRYVIDSNIFVAFYYDGDVDHKRALQILRELNSQLLVVHPYVIQETATVLAYKLGQLAAVNFLNDLENSVNVSIPPVDVKIDIKNFISLQKKISFTDSSLIALAKQLNAQMVTFDRQMLSIFKKRS
jgi:predicted nucleic acid-binding protein